MNNNHNILNKLIVKIINEGKVTIELGTPESMALIEVLTNIRGTVSADLPTTAHFDMPPGQPLNESR